MALFYVYALARPVRIKRQLEWRVFYVGKGKGRRVFDHENEAKSGHQCHKCNIIRKVWREGGEIQRYVLLTTENEQEAFDYERELIAFHGRENLCNHTDGGEGSSNPSDETRARMSETHKGRPHSEEHRQRISQSNTGKKHDPSIIERLRNIARNRSSEHLARISEANSRFTPEDVIEIRRKAQYQSITSIAREYGVSHSIISDIVRKKTWKHLP